MNLVGHLTKSLQDKFNLDPDTAREMAASINDARVGCGDTQCHNEPRLNEDDLAGVLSDVYSRLEHGSMDTRKIARFIIAEERAYGVLVDRWGGRFNKALASRLQREYKLPKILSYMLSAAFTTAGAGHDFANDVHNIDQLTDSLQSAYDVYGDIVSEDGVQEQVPASSLDISKVVEYSIEEFYGKPIYEAHLQRCADMASGGSIVELMAVAEDRTCQAAMSEYIKRERQIPHGPVISQGRIHDPDDYVDVRVDQFSPSTMPDVKRYDTSGIDRALLDNDEGDDDTDAAGVGALMGEAAFKLDPSEFRAPRVKPQVPRFRVIPGGGGQPAPVPKAPPSIWENPWWRDAPSGKHMKLPQLALGEAAAGAAVAAGVGLTFLGALNLASPQVQREIEGPSIAWEKSGEFTVRVLKPGREGRIPRSKKEPGPVIDPDTEILEDPYIEVAPREVGIPNHRMDEAERIREEVERRIEVPGESGPEVETSPRFPFETEDEDVSIMPEEETTSDAPDMFPEIPGEMPGATPAWWGPGEGVSEPQEFTRGVTIQPVAEAQPAPAEEPVTEPAPQVETVEPAREDQAGEVDADSQCDFTTSKLSEDRRQEVADHISGRELSSLSRDEQSDLITHLAQEKGWSLHEMQALIGPEGMSQHLGYGQDLPFGFTSRAQFDQFKTELLEAMVEADMPIDGPEVDIFIHGSSVTGASEKLGVPYRWLDDPAVEGKAGEASDLDVGIEVSPEIFTDLVLRKVRWVMGEHYGIEADDDLAAIATLKWLDTLNVDPATAQSEKELENIVNRAESVQILQAELRARLGDAEDLSIDTRGEGGLEWWERTRDANGETRVVRTIGSKRLSDALARQKIGVNNTDDAWREAYGGLKDDMRGAGFDRDVQISWLLEGSSFVPRPGELIRISADHFVGQNPIYTPAP